MRAKFEPVQPGEVPERSAESAAQGDRPVPGKDTVTLRDWQGGRLQLTLLPVERAILLDPCASCSTPRRQRI